MVKSYLQSVNDIVGEFRGREVYSIYGSASVGKSIYLMGEGINALKAGLRVVWIDTEGGFDGLWNKFKDKYAARFQYDFKGFDDNWEYHRVLTPEEFIRYLGIDIEVNYDKSKIEIAIKKFIEGQDTIYEKFGRKRDNLMVIVDSFSSPFKLGFTTNVQNFGARADAQGIAMMAAMKFMEKTNAILLASHHSSLNPTNPYQQVGNIRGGNTILYYSKHILDFEKPKKKVLDSFRKVYGVRTSIAKDWELMKWVKITEDGYVDSTEEEMEKASEVK